MSDCVPWYLTSTAIVPCGHTFNGRFRAAFIHSFIHTYRNRFTWHLVLSELQEHVTSCFAALRQIRRSVPTATLRSLVVALVHSRLDYDNGVLVGGIQAYLLRRFLSVLNAAARTIFHLRRCDHITDDLISLRTEYKTAGLTFKVIHRSAPLYLGKVARVADVLGRRVLRSSGTNRLVVPPYRLSTIGRRSFPVAAAHIRKFAA